MKLSMIISELERLKSIHGDIEAQIQDNWPDDDSEIVSHEEFFLVAEQYEDGWRVNLRSWPY